MPLENLMLESLSLQLQGEFMNKMRLEMLILFSEWHQSIAYKYIFYSRINIGGLGIGDGWMSPYHNGRYANFLYQASLLDAKQRDECLAYETETQRLIDAGQL